MTAWNSFQDIAARAFFRTSPPGASAAARSRHSRGNGHHGVAPVDPTRPTRARSVQDMRDAMSGPAVLVSLSSYGAAEVRRHGQAWFARVAHAAGADGIEVRGELLADPTAELQELARAVSDARMQVVYSSPDGLCAADGSLDHAALDRALEATAMLGAPRLKMSIGGFGARSDRAWPVLQERLRATGIELLVENDQTPAAGTVPALQRFLAAGAAHGVALPMTFDMGNWHWTGECPLLAAQALAPSVRYVHCKGVQRLPRKWIAVPLAESQAPWRTVLRALPAGVPWAIEYPLAGDDLAAVTRAGLAQLRALAAPIPAGDA